MTKPVQTVVQHLSRAKAAFLKGQTLRPMVSIAEALKVMLTAQLHSTELQKVASLLRENLQNVSKLEAVAARRKEPFVFQKGGEKQILAQLVPLIRAIHADRKKESMEAVRARKLNIDKAINHAQNALSAGKLDEAKEYFRQAAHLYVDEDAMYLIIATKLQAGEFFKESFEYLRPALQKNNNDRKACDMLVIASQKIGKPDRGLVLIKKIREKQGDSPYLLFAQARLSARKKQFMEAVKLCKQALSMDPELMEVKKYLRKVEAKAAKAK
ncbi:hypothetical protein [Desulfovibrio ferrophilus]|uniref:Uncharacterized protein n=1 Tax=Desulfovibrio ferrophilus TaxID=241368 RepID=A0A2Z6B0N9_9BACT|nr:hypothetical protein [Desulfovibrio ferrophilus]BBD09044.1 uncharacterized protein DFE_2318 [Desulfovibrio ferrophilus]